MSGLHDIYRELSGLSCTLQIPVLYSWQAEERITLSRNKLSRMAENLRSFTTFEEFSSVEEDGKNPLKSFTAALKNLKPDNMTFKDKPIFLKQHVPGATNTRSTQSDARFAENDLASHIKASQLKLASYMENLNAKIAARMEKGSRSVLDINSSIKSLFSMAAICEREKGEVPEDDLRYYSNLAKEATYLEGDIGFEELKEEYVSFSESVYDHAKINYESYDNFMQKRQYEKKYYTKSIVAGAYDARSYSSITHLLSSATLRLSNESIVESIGSVIKQHTLSRGRLEPEMLTKETFVSWNGPPCNVNAIPLVDLAMADHFHTKDPTRWNLVHADTNQSRLDSMPGMQSIVLKRMNQKDGRISFAEQ